VRLGSEAKFFYDRENRVPSVDCFLGILWGEIGAITENFGHLWTIRNAQPIEPGANFLRSFGAGITVQARVGLFVPL